MNLKYINKLSIGRAFDILSRISFQFKIWDLRLMGIRPANKSIIAFVLVLSSAMNVQAQESEGVLIDKIVAKVDDYIILKSEMEKSYLEMISRGELTGASTKCQVLENLVINKLMVAKAEIDSIVVENAEVNSNLERRMAYFISQIGSVEQIEEYYGKTLLDFRAELFESIKEQMIVQKMQGEIGSGIEVSPAEVRRFFKKIPADSLPFFSTEVAIAQIVKIPEINKKQKAEVRSKLNKIRDRILNGESFAALAKQYSMDPGSGSKGGELGFFKRGELAPEFEAAAIGMKPGDITEPVETQFGFHIIQLIERRGNSYNSRHILIIPESSQSDIDEARHYLDSLKVQIEADTITFQKAAKEYSDDQATSGNGGFFSDATGASRISVEQLDPVVFFTIDTMKTETITAPMDYRMEDGTDAVRIIYYKDKIRPHQASLEDDYQKIRSATLANKRNKILDKWFKTAKGDVFILIDPEYSSCDIMKD